MHRARLVLIEMSGQRKLKGCTPRLASIFSLAAGIGFALLIGAEINRETNSCRRPKTNATREDNLVG